MYTSTLLSPVTVAVVRQKQTAIEQEKKEKRTGKTENVQ